MSAKTKALTEPGARVDSSGQSMVVHNLDLNYLGVSSVWNNDLGIIALFFVC